MRLTTTASLLAAVATMTTSAAFGSSVSSHVAEGSLISPAENWARFDSLQTEDDLSGYTEDGIALDVTGIQYDWSAPGLDSSGFYYASAGVFSLVEVSLVSGDDFGAMDMQIGSGWNQNAGTTMYLWAQVYNDGSLVDEFDINAMVGSHVGFSGGDFDMIRIGAYASAGLRDAHNEQNRNAIGIDNVRVGNLVPAPSGIALGGVAIVLGGTRRRR